jgi:autotransporter-associated beta strand protein
MQTTVYQDAGHQVRFINGADGITDLSSGGTVGSIEGAGTFLIGNSVAVGSNNLDTTVTGIIAERGIYNLWPGVFEKIGTGTLTLDGVNTYTGWTTVSAGTLVIGDSGHSSAFVPGSVEIDAGGTLMGYGSIGGNLANSGILQPAAAGAALRVNGNYGQNAGGKLVIAVTPTAAATLAVGGSAALAGTVQFVYAPGTYGTKNYPIVTAANGVTGTFATVEGNSPSSDLTQSVNYGTNEVDLVLAAPAKIAAPVNSTILSNAASIGTGNASAALDLVFAHLDAGLVGDPGDTIETALSGAAPVKLASNDFVQSAQLSDAMQGIPAAMKRYGGWFRGIGSFNSAHSQGAAPGYHGRSGGFLGGIDRAITSDITLGIAAGYSHTDFAESDGTSGAIDTPRLLGYGLYHLGGVAIEATLGFAYDRISAARPVPALGVNALEGHNGFEKSAALQAAYPLAAGEFTIVPRAGAQYVRLDENKFAESGAGGFDLSSAGSMSQSLQPGIGASVLTSQATDDDIKIAPEIKAMYARELLGTSRNLVLTTASGSAMNAIAVTPAHNILTLGPRVTARLAGDLELVADYTLSLGLGKSVGHTIFAGARKSF